jgi:uncharacterized protein (TIGR03086 family)
MTEMDTYRRTQDALDAVLATVQPDEWDAPTKCPEWTVKDITGHVIWAQEQLRHWAIGEEYTDGRGAPGAPHPAVLTGDDPLATWRDARARSVAELTDEALTRMITLPGMGEVPLVSMVTTFATDQLAHTWDIGHALGQRVKLDDDLVKGSFAWSRSHILRRPGFFGPEVTVPDGADEQTRWLAFLGRAT